MQMLNQVQHDRMIKPPSFRIAAHGGGGCSYYRASVLKCSATSFPDSVKSELVQPEVFEQLD